MIPRPAKLGSCLSSRSLAIEHRAGLVYPCRAAELVFRIELHQLLGELVILDRVAEVEDRLQKCFRVGTK